MPPILHNFNILDIELLYALGDIFIKFHLLTAMNLLRLQ